LYSWESIFLILRDFFLALKKNQKKKSHKKFCIKKIIFLPPHLVEVLREQKSITAYRKRYKSSLTFWKRKA